MASSPKAPPLVKVADTIDVRLVRKLADILTETGLSEIEVEHEGLKVRVAKTLTAPPMQVQAPVYASAPAPATSTAAASASEEPAAKARAAGDTVNSPMVGMVYL